MKIAIIGTGIAGNTAAWYLRRNHDITVFEANSYIGGHTNTVDVFEGNRRIPVDTGFIVFNDRTYPNFLALLDELGQSWKPSIMSFSVQSEADGIEYNGASLNALFAQRRNIVRPPFYRMIRDILRFNREATAVLQGLPVETRLGEYLAQHNYSEEFGNHYLVPMAAAIWSAEPGVIWDMPLHFLVRFFDNHGLLSLDDRPTWRVIEGGSREYVTKIVADHRDRIRLRCPVRSIRRHGDRVLVKADGCETESFDYVFVACHSDQALSMLADATSVEREVLGNIRYQPNTAVLHTDRSLLPARRRAWAAWNYHIPADERQRVAVTYNMNMLQGLDAKQQYFVTLNSDDKIDPAKVIRRISYDHPIITNDTVAAQSRHAEVNRGNRTFYCGAYWRNGFHEDGVVSALTAIRHFEEAMQHEELHFRRAG